MWFIKIFAIGLFCLTGSLAQNTYKICATDKHKTQCEQLQRGQSQVQCQWVQDSIECATRLQNGTADFGAITAESALQMSVLNMDGFFVIKELRHQARVFAPVDYESVVVVRKDHQGDLAGLRRRKYCHPGYHYSKTQKWTERFLKHMERLAVEPKCQPGQSTAELEIASLSQFFGESCRPGIWSHDKKEDNELKKKYSSLCKLCPASDCKYDERITVEPDLDKHHQLALKCLKNSGDVTYVSRQDAIKFFEKEGDGTNFRYLCPNKTLQAVVDNKNPCGWLRQPWSTVIARNAKVIEIGNLLDTWFRNGKSGGINWESAVVEILGAVNYEAYRTTTQSTAEYLRQYRNIPRPETTCNTEISWCTITPSEFDKCNIIRAGGISTGLQPLIICRDPVYNVVECLDDIGKNNSDFMGIDSNYGYLARKVYNLTAAMFFETEVEQYSSVVIVINENSDIKKISNLRGKKLCLPEFGATPSISLINWGKEQKLFDKNECRYGMLLNKFFGKSCAPGAQDWKHIVTGEDRPDSLCELCLESRSQINVTINTSSGKANQQSTQIGNCSPNETNDYYGNRGALRCLKEVGEVAILELQSLKDHALDVGVDQSQFRVLCKNGSLAQYPGFDVDLKCALSTIVDGEIVVRRGTPKTSSIVNALNAFDLYFQIDPDFKMYNIFNGTRNLLFKDSTIGISAVNEDNHSDMVSNYIDLFKNIEKCVGNSATMLSVSILTIFLMTAIAKILIN